MRLYKIILIILSILLILEGILIIHLWMTIRLKKVPGLVLPPKGKIAICIDDWGYHQHTLEIVSQIKYPLTIAVLPNLNYSSEIAKILNNLGFEIILHLPMEPYEKYRLEKDTVLSSMDEPAIIAVLNKDLADVGYAKGVSNHMGSKLTSDLRAMGIIFKELKKRHLYFLDSVVTAKSLCFRLARKMKLKFAQRDIFLDNQEEPEYIRMQINRLKTKARIFGQAIGICHDRSVTLEVLKEIIPELEKEGYKFVFVSELVR